MGSDYVTRNLVASTAATATYTALSADSSGGTPGSIKVPQGRNRISKLIASASPESTVVIDVGNVYVIKLSGKGLPTGDQEIIIGSVISQEDGTSVGITVDSRASVVIPVSIACSGGNEITISGSYSGTDTGAQNYSVTLEFSTGVGPVANYYTRLDSMGQATATYNAVETTADGATSTITTEKTARRITRLITAVVLNAAGAVTGANFIVKLSATGMTEQEIVVGSTVYEAGGGTTTDTFVQLYEPQVLPVDISLTGGNNLNIAASYVGTDPGTPFIGVTVEVF